MKKLFLLFAVAGFVLASCGGNAQEQTEQKTEQAVEQADSTTANATEVADSTSCCSGDSTETTDAVQE